MDDQEHDARVREYMEATTIGEFAAIAYPRLRKWLEEAGRLLSGKEYEDPDLLLFAHIVQEGRPDGELESLLTAIEQHVWEGREAHP